MNRKKILCVIGTRPEVMKMAPIINLLKKDNESLLRVLTTAQHREMLDEMLQIFGIVPDIDLNIMKDNQTLPQLTSSLPLPLDRILQEEYPDFILAQGDTTTAFLVSLAAHYRKIPFGHVEAGLRTWSAYNPFPEEMNRSLISRLSTLHFAPTENASMNLIREGLNRNNIFITGNTIIDSLKEIMKRDLGIDPRIDPKKRLILLTVHRRESIGSAIEEICKAVRAIVDANFDVQVLCPVHPNPGVSKIISQELTNHPRIILTKPLGYEAFVKTMQNAYVILSDSGGVQEEAPSLKTPVLVLREKTERTEALQIGASKLVGHDYKTIINATQTLLDHPLEYKKMIVPVSPYGDGNAGKRIVHIVKSYLEKHSF